MKGDMSIVGPRPALPREVEQYTEYDRQRLYVTPGLSCYWQIAPHRNDLSFEEWMALDVKYVKERSFWVDWKIIFKTFKVCLLRTAGRPHRGHPRLHCAGDGGAPPAGHR